MKEQIEKIDNILITTSIAFLAASFVLYSVNQNENIYFNISTIASLIFITLCLLLTLYAKYRESLRKSIFDSKKNQWNTELQKDLDTMIEDFYAPQLLQRIKNALGKEENMKLLQEKTKTITEILEVERKVWEVQNKNQDDYPRKLFAENQGLKMQKMIDSAFSGPLKEKHSIIKYQLEIFSKKRFILFVLGLVFFIFSISTKMFI